MRRALERAGCEAHYGKHPNHKSGHLSFQPSEEAQDVRPHLTTLLRDNGEAQLLIIELEPDIFAE